MQVDVHNGHKTVVVADESWQKPSQDTALNQIINRKVNSMKVKKNKKMKCNGNCPVSMESVLRVYNAKDLWKK